MKGFQSYSKLPPVGDSGRESALTQSCALSRGEPLVSRLSAGNLNCGDWGFAVPFIRSETAFDTVAPAWPCQLVEWALDAWAVLLAFYSPTSLESHWSASSARSAKMSGF